jgi:hypothetical protein
LTPCIFFLYFSPNYVSLDLLFSFFFF